MRTFHHAQAVAMFRIVSKPKEQIVSCLDTPLFFSLQLSISRKTGTKSFCTRLVVWKHNFFFSSSLFCNCTCMLLCCAYLTSSLTCWKLHVQEPHRVKLNRLPAFSADLFERLHLTLWSSSTWHYCNGFLFFTTFLCASHNLCLHEDTSR